MQNNDTIIILQQQSFEPAGKSGSMSSWPYICM